MLIALIVAAQIVTIEQAIPSNAQTTDQPVRTEYRMEQVGETLSKVNNEEGNGYWHIEHYQQFEYHFDPRGKLLEKRPTNHTEHIRYWQSTN